jgi:LacI family transcriptional regulator
MARVTLKQVAEAAEVSKAAASLALRGKAGISEKTRQHVLRVAERLDYRPDPNLNVLTDLRWSKTGSTRLAKLAFYTEVHEAAKFLRLELEGARSAASHLGYVVEEYVQESVRDPAKLPTIWRDRGVDGVLLGFQSSKPGWNPRLNYSELSVVAIGCTPTGMKVHQVRANHYQIIEEAWARVRGQGFRRIGYCYVTQPRMAQVDQRRLGFHGWVQGYDTVPEDQVPALNVLEASPEELEEWLDRWKPEAVVISFALREAVEKIQSRGIPLFSLSSIERTLPGMRVDPRKIGAAACNLLASLHRSGELGLPNAPNVMLVSGEWHEGQ